MRIVKEETCSVPKNMLWIDKNILTLFVQNYNYWLLLLHPFNLVVFHRQIQAGKAEYDQEAAFWGLVIKYLNRGLILNKRCFLSLFLRTSIFLLIKNI